MNKKIICILTAALTAASLYGCEKQAEKPENMPENIISYEERDGKDLVPVDETEVGGTEGGGETLELPDEDELGEYQEVFMEGDVIDDETLGGWVVQVSLKDITVNTYNKLTTYAYEDSAANTAVHLKPGDAVVLTHREDEDGNHFVSSIGRVNMEDDPLTKEEVDEMLKNSQETEAADAGE